MTHIPDAAIHAALLSMAQDNIGADVQGLLMHGFDKLRVKPNALRNALTAAHPHLSAPCAVEVVDRAKRIANIYRNKDDATVIASFHKETARVIDELLSCVVSKPVDVAAVRRQALEDALHAISDLPTGKTEDIMEGQEQAYRVVEGLLKSETLSNDTFSGAEDSDTKLQAAAREAGWALMELVDTIDWKKRSHVSKIITELGMALEASENRTLSAAPTLEAGK
ncbi:MAG TPA: hypothetical protein VG519_13160 [Pseudochrobactrum sp.]|nr:hypothetical protein [Pseudochrobactrum sp.]